MSIINNTLICSAALAFTFLATVTLSEESFSIPASNFVMVKYDLGGRIDRRMEEVTKYKEAGTRIEIAGTCSSACTLLLGLDNLCVHPDAVLSFHGPRYLGGERMPDKAFETWSTKMAEYYPKGLDNWFLEVSRHERSNWRFRSLEGRDVYKYGIEECAPRRSVPRNFFKKRRQR